MNITCRTFWDFSSSPKFKWIYQSLVEKNVSFYWDNKNKAWCRRIDNVKCEEKPDCFLPLPNQLVGYCQWK